LTYRNLDAEPQTVVPVLSTVEHVGHKSISQRSKKLLVWLLDRALTRICDDCLRPIRWWERRVCVDKYHPYAHLHCWKSRNFFKALVTAQAPMPGPLPPDNSAPERSADNTARFGTSGPGAVRVAPPQKARGPVKSAIVTRSDGSASVIELTAALDDD
jgi:hypothetical protein